MTNTNELTAKLKDVARHSVDGYGRQDICYNDPEGEFVFYSDYVALTEALEAALRANAAQDDHINQQQDRIDQLEKGHNEAAKHIHSWRRLAKQNIAEREKDIAALTDARQRIAELEARTLTVKLPQGYTVRAGHPINEGERGVMIPKDGGDWLNRFDVEHELRVAGIKLQIEGE